MPNRHLFQFRLRTLMLCVTAGGIICTVGLWLYDAVDTIDWVGSTDLEINFVVTDEATELPIEGATIAVRSEGGLYQESNEKQFSLTTGHDGSASRICHDNMCAGVQSGLRRTDTFGVDLPWWILSVSHSGYATSQPIYLDSVGYAPQVQRLPGRNAKLIVKIPLRKDGA